MTNEQIDKLLELEARATPGPWFEQYEYDGARTVATLRSTNMLMCVNRALHVEGAPYERSWENARLIAYARNHIRELAEEVKRLREFAWFDRLDLTHRPTYVLHLLNEGEISFAKASEWLRAYAAGNEMPIIEAPVGKIPDDMSFADTWAELKRLREENERLRDSKKAAEQP